MRGNNIHKLCQPLYLSINLKYKRNMKINEFIHAYYKQQFEETSCIKWNE